MILETESAISKAAGILQAGGVVIVPTETFYALAADPFQDQAIKRIFRIKSRSENMPLPMIAAQRAIVDGMSPVPCAMARALMANFWPGSLTILLESNLPFSQLVRGLTGKIGVRIPPNCPARRLAELTGGWITATSANLTGGASPDKVTDIPASIINGVDLVLDLGRTPGGKPSTVVDPLQDGLRFVREGAVSKKAIVETLTGLPRDKSSLTG
jgi:L-threonylcarbamoyladenylate synthase